MSAQIIQFPVKTISVKEEVVVETPVVEEFYETPKSHAANQAAVADTMLRTDDKEFVVGKTYYARSICDYDTVFKFTVIKRTAKRLTLQDEYGETRVRGVSLYDGVETCSPYGSYSMSATIYANRYLK